jgi:hypothetical protein
MQFELLEETFTNEVNKEEVPGVTVIIDGDLKRVLDAIMKLDPSYQSYTGIIANALVRGINKAALIYTNDELAIIEEDFFNEKTTQKVRGIRIMIIGQLKALLEKQISSGEFKSYSAVIGADLKTGLNDVITVCRNRMVQNE